MSLWGNHVCLACEVGVRKEWPTPNGRSRGLAKSNSFNERLEEYCAIYKVLVVLTTGGDQALRSIDEFDQGRID